MQLPLLPKGGDQRRVTKFLWFPLELPIGRVDGERARFWLRRVIIEQEYYAPSQLFLYTFPMCGKCCYWRDLFFVDPFHS